MLKSIYGLYTLLGFYVGVQQRLFLKMILQFLLVVIDDSYDPQTGLECSWDEREREPGSCQKGYSYKPLEPSQGNPTRLIRDHERLLGVVRPCWEDLATLP